MTSPAVPRRLQKNRRLILALAFSMIGLSASGGESVPARRPNFVFILVDDLGWMDTSSYGSQYYETPAIDRLAHSGVLFRDAYAASPVCSPSRAAILTGHYPVRQGILNALSPRRNPVKDPFLPERAGPSAKLLFPVGRTQLALPARTIAEALHEAGYATAHIGKWHLGPKPYGPERQGFDVNIAGSEEMGSRYFSPYGIPTLEDGPAGEYIVDRLTDEALRFITENRERPFYLQLWHFAVHSPWRAKPERVQKYRDKHDPRGRQRNPTIAAIIESVDESVGRLVARIEELGLRRDTVVIFTSDNGQLTRVPGKLAGARRTGSLLRVGELVTSNAPLRGGKGSLYEGGTRVPLIVSWPGQIRAGRKSEEVVSGVDFYPTILAMARLEPRPGAALDGVNLLPLLRNEAPLERAAIFCDYLRPSAGSYVRVGDEKLIRFYGSGPWGVPRRELYDLRNDIGETTNLAERRPERVLALEAMLDQHLQATGALLPRPNPDFGPPAGSRPSLVILPGSP